MSQIRTGAQLAQLLGEQLAEVDPAQIGTWPLWMGVSFCGVIALGLEILSRIVPLLFGSAGKIEVRGKHLDKFEAKDNLFITINKGLTMIFVYHLIQVTCHPATRIVWSREDLTLLNSVGSLVAFYVCYDLLYMLFHRLLHIPSLYAYVHKHHHQQKAPSRGNLDAINVHPFEFVVGEYIHLLTIYVVPCHIYAVVVFILAGGVLASLNHTRYDVSIPYLYSVKVHDVHHRLPMSNYGQYTMLWDRIFGTYRSYGITLDCKDD